MSESSYTVKVIDLAAVKGDTVLIERGTKVSKITVQKATPAGTAFEFGLRVGFNSASLPVDKFGVLNCADEEGGISYSVATAQPGVAVTLIVGFTPTQFQT